MMALSEPRVEGSQVIKYMTLSIFGSSYLESLTELAAYRQHFSVLLSITAGKGLGNG